MKNQRCKMSSCGKLYLGESYHETALDLIRIYLGFAIFIRGLLFLRNEEILLQWAFHAEGLNFLGTTLVHCVVLTHLAGGVLLIFGLFTRFSALVQLPILFVAVFFVHFSEGFLAIGQSLELSSLVLFLLCIIAFLGAGSLSLDACLFPKK